MTSLFSDTHPKIESLQLDLWRRASPTKKMQMLADLNRSARLLAIHGLRLRFPEASESELRYKLACMVLGEELARNVYRDKDNLVHEK